MCFIIKKFTTATVLFLTCLYTVQAQTAMDVAQQMVPGWNLGNTLEAGPCSWLSNDVDWETGWQRTKTSQQIIYYIHNLGFRSVRIPCSWYIHMDNCHQINVAWMERVKEVVDYCIHDGLYVLLNDHWDNGWLEHSFDNLSEETVEKNCAILHTMWTQIATTFADYDHHLLFAGMNEPNAQDAAAAAVLQRYLQTFVDAVRQTGGNNASRILVAQAPCTNIDLSCAYNVLPSDPTPNALMLEVHYYSPYPFIGMNQDEEWGYMAYYWGQGNHLSGSKHNATWGEESYIQQQMDKLRTVYTSKDIPVIIGEFGGTWRIMPEGESQEKHDASIRDWYKTVCRYAIDNGAVPMVWDTNSCTRPSGTLVDRKNQSVFNQFAYDGIIQSVSDATWPYASGIAETIKENERKESNRWSDGKCYNMMGIPVEKGYRGFVIKNGRKTGLKRL